MNILVPEVQIKESHYITESTRWSEAIRSVLKITSHLQSSPLSDECP